MVVGKELRDKHDGPKSRLRVAICGEPSWADFTDHGRLELWYEETDCTFRASQPVTICNDTQATPPADKKAALDIGANNLVAYAPQLMNNPRPKVVSCSNDSVKQREKSLDYSRKLNTDSTVASVSDDCIRSGLAAATTHKKHCVET